MFLFVQQDHFSSQGGGLNALAAGGAGGMYNTFNQPSGVSFLSYDVNVQTELKSPTERENSRSLFLRPPLSMAEGCQVTLLLRFLEIRPLLSPQVAPWLRPTRHLAAAR